MPERLLIEMIPAFPHLFDPTNKNFKDTDMRETSWQTISAALNISVEDCKRMWKNLRDRYGRERKKLPTGSGALVTCEWEFFHQMSFMEDVIKPRRRYSKITSTGKRKGIEGTSQHEHTESQYNSLENILGGTSKRMKKMQGSDELCALDQTLANSSNEHLIKKTTTNTAFGQYVAFTLDDLPVEEQKRKRLLICQILED